MRKINLDPQKRPQSVLTIFGGALSERDANKVSSENGHTAPQNGNENNAPPVASPVSHPTNTLGQTKLSETYGIKIYPSLKHEATRLRD